MVGKRAQFDDETWAAIVAVAQATGSSFQQLADEAFADPAQEAQAAGGAHGERASARPPKKSKR